MLLVIGAIAYGVIYLTSTVSLGGNQVIGEPTPNTAVKALPLVAGTRRKRRAPYLQRWASNHA
jgi:hypothetical protein